MEAPQWIYLGLAALDWTMCAIRHGEPRGDYHIGLRSIDTAIILGILYWGGFFK